MPKSRKDIKKYAPEELLEYAKDSGLYEDLFFATNNNTRGYMHIFVIGKIIEADGGAFFEFEGEKGKPQHFPLEPAALQLVGAKVGGHIISYDETLSIVLVKADDGTEPDPEDKDFIAAVTDVLLLDFFTQLGIETVEDLAKLVREENQIWNRLKNKKSN